MTLAAWPYPRWIAHRGAGKLAPENTLAAFRLGAQYGYRAFECDVKLSLDGVPFLLHDDTLERTSSGLGAAADQPWSELSQLDAGSWHSRSFAGEPLASLAAIAGFCLRNQHALNLEIKPSPGRERETGEIVAREAARLWAGQAVPPLLSSFKPEALEGAMAGAARLPRALLLDELWAGWFERAQALACVAIVANYKLIDRAMVERLHGAGLRALAYTVNDEAAASKLLDFGIDGLITDEVDCFAPYRCAKPQVVATTIRVPPADIRVLAICVFSHRGRILVNEAFDPVKQLAFCRPLGGGIEFGETSVEAVAREIREEIRAEVSQLRLIGTLENIFTYLGAPGHEIVQVYDGEFVDRALYQRDAIAGTESDGAPLRAVWRSLESFTPSRPLFPEGLLALLQR